MRRIISALALTLLLLLGWSSPSDATEPEQVSTECVGQITGPGTAEVTGDCLLLSYSYSPDATVLGSFPDSLPQTLFGQTAGAGSLTVALPPCAWQVDLVSADAEVVETLTAEWYGPHGWLVDSEHGGAFCETTTTTSTTVPQTTTTVPQTTTTVTVPETTVTTVPTTPTSQSNELARTGISDYRQHLMVIFGLMVAGGALVWLSKSYREQYA